MIVNGATLAFLVLALAITWALCASATADGQLPADDPVDADGSHMSADDWRARNTRVLAALRGGDVRLRVDSTRLR